MDSNEMASLITEALDHASKSATPSIQCEVRTDVH